MMRRIDSPAGSEKTFVADMAAGVKGGQQHDIVAIRIQLAIGLVGELQVGHNNTRLQLEICKMKN